MTIRIETWSNIAIAVLIAGLIGYAIALVLATFFGTTAIGVPLKAWFDASPASNIGIPCSAIAAFAIVTTLLSVFKSSKQSDDQLKIEAFSLVFTGPSGPVTLWLMCFLGFVFAIKLLR